MPLPSSPLRRRVFLCGSATYPSTFRTVDDEQSRGAKTPERPGDRDGIDEERKGTHRGA